MSDRTPEAWFHQTATAYVKAQLLHHLASCGVVALLAAEGPLAAPAIAERLGLVPTVLESMLEYVAGVDDLIVRDPEGAYALTAFGRAVVERYGRQTSAGLRLNLFDVRVGSYGPVWAAAGDLLRGDAVYGRDVLRKGDAAAGALYTIAARMGPPLRRLVTNLGVRAAAEVGVTTGLVGTLAGAGSLRVLFGVDRSHDELARARRAAEAEGQPVRFVQGDFFDPEPWAARLAGEGPGVLFTVHFHELAAGGAERLGAALRRLDGLLPGWYVVALEQPYPDRGAQASTPCSLWLYGWSNVLIHHLIGNGRILTDAAWTDLFGDGGARPVRSVPLDYLGYVAYVASLGATP